MILQGSRPPQVGRATRPIARKGFINAKERLETKEEVENASRSREALQGHRHRQNSPHAFRQAPPAGNESPGPHAQAEEADAGEQGGCRLRSPNASVRLGGFTGGALRLVRRAKALLRV